MGGFSIHESDRHGFVVLWEASLYRDQDRNGYNFLGGVSIREMDMHGYTAF